MVVHIYNAFARYGLGLQDLYSRSSLTGIEPSKW